MYGISSCFPVFILLRLFTFPFNNWILLVDKLSISVRLFLTQISITITGETKYGSHNLQGWQAAFKADNSHSFYPVILWNCKNGKLLWQQIKDFTYCWVSAFVSHDSHKSTVRNENKFNLTTYGVTTNGSYLHWYEHRDTHPLSFFCNIFPLFLPTNENVSTSLCIIPGCNKTLLLEMH